MDLVRGEWLMSLDVVNGYMPLVHQLLSGQPIQTEVKSSLLSMRDSNGKLVLAAENGQFNTPQKSVAIIEMIGPVTKYSGMCNHGADSILRAMQYAEDNPNCIGTILVQDCPGGAVSAIGPFLEFAKTKKKPIVALVDTCASLAYWSACAVADHIMTDNSVSACIGSVGVVMTILDESKYLEDKGIKLHEIYPQESNYKNLPFQLAKKGEYDMIKTELLSPLAIKFQDAVRAARPNLTEETGVLTGKVFGAEKALELGMIDSVGSLSKAMQWLHVKSELNHYN
jgi:protease-4